MNCLKLILRTAFTLVLVFSFILPPAIANAAGETLSLNVSAGNVNQQISVTGSGFDTAYQVILFFGKNPGTTISSAGRFQIVKTTAVNSGGTFSTSFYIPPMLLDGTSSGTVEAGPYYVFAAYKTGTGIDDYTNTPLGKVSFNILGGNLQMYPESGPPGTEVSLTCMDFSGNEQLQIKFDEEIISSLQTAQAVNGIVSNLKVYIPASTAGLHALTITGQTSYVQSGKLFTVTPGLVLKPEQGSAGSSITISGLGFSGNAPFNMLVDGTQLMAGTTQANGSFIQKFDPYTFTQGDHVIQVMDNVGNTAQHQLSIFDTSVTLEPENGGPAAVVAISGSGFEKSHTVTVSFEGIASNYNVTTQSDANGDFSTTFTVPWDTMGEKDIQVTDGDNTKTVTFEVNVSGLIDPLTNATTPGFIGNTVSIAGTNFNPGSPVSVTFDGTPVQTISSDGTQNVTVYVQDSGAFTGVFFYVPSSTSGIHLIQATDGTHTIDYNYYIESEPPVQAVTLLPLPGTKESSQPFFDWDDVEDVSGVTYTLQVATDQGFTSIVREETNINVSEFEYPNELNAVTEANPYYWRVRAVDRASNAGLWSDVGSFYVGGGASLPQWAIYLIIVGVAIGLSVFTFWLGRKTAYY